MPDSLVAVVEIPKGSSNKYEWDEELGAIKLDRLLFSSLGYPTDYGFFRETIAADGDPLDAMIVVSEPTFPGCLIEVKPVALFRMRDENAEDNKILCVPHTDPNWSHIEHLDDLPMTLRDEISHFFSIYKTPEWKVVKVDGWYSREEALESIERAQRRWREAQRAVACASRARSCPCACATTLTLTVLLRLAAQVDHGAAAADLHALAGDGDARLRAAHADREAPAREARARRREHAARRR